MKSGRHVGMVGKNLFARRRRPLASAPSLSLGHFRRMLGHFRHFVPVLSRRHFVPVLSRRHFVPVLSAATMPPC